MKPSENIKEIYERYIQLPPDQLGSKELMFANWIQAICTYLDECAEREDERIAEFKRNIKPMD